MLSDSSSSDLNCSPVIQRKLKRYQVSTDDSSDDDVLVRRPLRGVRSRVPSSSSSSSFSDRPRKRRRAIVESESSSESCDSYESDGPTLPFRKDRRSAIQSDSDGYSSEIQAALGTSSAKYAKNDGSSSDSEGEHCIICFKTLHHPVAQPSSCSHIFHEQCLSTWSKTSNTCPIDRVKYNCINTVNSDGKVLSKRNVSTPTPGNHSDFEPDNPTFCEVCHFHDREEVMLLCDRCDAGYHIDCLDPPMARVPIGQWFCHACELTNIEDNEVLELLADNVLMDSRLRNRPERPTRMNPRLGFTRAVRAALNLANNASSQVTSNISEEPSTSTGRRATSVKKPRKTRKNSRRKHSNTTKYKVELVTTEDGTPVEVKLAIQSRGGHRKKKKTSSKRSHRRSGGRCKDEGGAGSSQSHHRSTYQTPSLDLFGSRPTLDYFSGCEGGDEEEFGGGGGVGLLRAGQSTFAGRSGLITRKGIAQVLASSSSSPRPRINIEAPVSSVNVLDDILRDQELWHHPGPANISSSSNGAVRVTLPKDSSGCPTRESAIHGGRNENRGGGRYGGGRYNGGRYGGGRPHSRSGVSGRNLSGGQSNASTSSTSGAGPSGSSSGSFRHSQSNFSPIQPIPAPPVPPLAPPPEPPLRLVEDDDLDIYGDIEPPPAMAKLVPPPEPPAMLLALDNQAADEGASSPDEALVIDDQRDTYDPDQPNSPSSGNRTDEEDSSEKTPVELPDIPLPTQGIRLEDIKLPSPSKNDDDSDSEVPITEHYSKASLKIARNSSDSSEEDGQYIDDIIERFKKAPPLKEDVSESDKKLNDHVDDDQSPVKEKLRKFEKERSTNETSNEIIKDKETEELSLSCVDKDEQVSDKSDKCGEDLRESERALCSEDSTPLRDEKELSEDERADIDDSMGQPEDSNFKDCEAKRPSTPPQIEDISLNVDYQMKEEENDGEEMKCENDGKEKRGEKDHTASVECGSPEERGEDEELKECDNEDHTKSCELDRSAQYCDVSSNVSKSLDKSDENKLLAEGDPFDSPAPSPKPQRRRKSVAKSTENENLESDNRVDTEKTNTDNNVEMDQDINPEGQALSTKDGNEGYLSAEDKLSIDDDEIGLHNGHKSRSLSPANSLSSGEVQSDGSDSLDISDCSSLPSPKRRSRKRKFRKNDFEDDNEYEGALNDSLNSGLAEGDKDGLVEITDDEMSSYEKNWEIEENVKHLKQSGLEGLETEAISECEDALCEDGAPAPQVKSNTETYLSKEEGEIITDDRNEFIPWKRVTKSTKDRSYREKDKTKDRDKDKTPEKKKKDKKQKEKRKDLERYDIRKVIGDKRKKDEFGRDIVSSQSRSASRESGVVRSEVRRVRDWSKTRKRSRARSLSRSRNRDKSTSRGNGKRRRSRGRSLDRNRAKYTRDKDRKRSRGRSKTRKDQSRDRKKSQTSKSTDKKRGVDKSSERRDRSGGKDKSRDDRDKKAVSSSSCSTCSCSSCERERLATNKLTVSVPTVQNPPTKKSKDKKKEKSRKTAKKDNKRRRTESPLPSKEVFTSGDNILVSVNFKSSTKTAGEPTRRGGSRRVWEEENRKKKDKENQPVRSVVPILAATQEKDKRRQRRRMASNAKPVAIIDLDPSPFREEAVSPAEVIILTDESDNEAGGKQGDAIHQSSSTGPKTPPEPPVKFTISSKPPLRSLTNPLEEADEEGDRGDDDGGEPIVMHKGPNTPPEPPETYDPFEPTKSRSPSPRRENIRGPSSTDTQIVNNSEALSDGKQQPSPQPKTQEVANAEKPNFVMEADLEFSLGGDSPYSPGSSEADDLFDPPPVTPTRSKPLRPLGALPLPATPVAANKPKITPSPTKRRQPGNRLTPVMRKAAAASKKEVGIRLDENQLKILDELPSSAVEMQVKDKFLKKLNRQERVVEEVKFVLKPHYNKKHVTKEEYKDILRKAVPKICHSKSGEINPFKIQKLIEAYVKKYRHKRKKTGPALPKTKTAKVLPPILKSMFGNLGMRSQDTLNNRNTANKTM